MKQNIGKQINKELTEGIRDIVKAIKNIVDTFPEFKQNVIIPNYTFQDTNHKEVKRNGKSRSDRRKSR